MGTGTCKHVDLYAGSLLVPFFLPISPFGFASLRVFVSSCLRGSTTPNRQSNKLRNKNAKTVFRYYLLELIPVKNTYVPAIIKSGLSQELTTKLITIIWNHLCKVVEIVPLD